MTLSDAEFERQYSRATRRGEERLQFQPHAVAVRYDGRSHKVVIDLSNGCSLLVPRDVAQGLAAASERNLANVTILGPGTTIAWPKLDIHFSVSELLLGSFGTTEWMKKLGRSRRHPDALAKTPTARRTATKSRRNGKSRGEKHLARGSV